MWCDFTISLLEAIIEASLFYFALPLSPLRFSQFWAFLQPNIKMGFNPLEAALANVSHVSKNTN